jgi:hypothetical protein
MERRLRAGLLYTTSDSLQAIRTRFFGMPTKIKMLSNLKKYE